jgi:hypothetical protein
VHIAGVPTGILLDWALDVDAARASRLLAQQQLSAFQRFDAHINPMSTVRGFVGDASERGVDLRLVKSQGNLFRWSLGARFVVRDGRTHLIGSAKPNFVALAVVPAWVSGVAAFLLRPGWVISSAAVVVAVGVGLAGLGMMAVAYYSAHRQAHELVVEVARILQVPLVSSEAVNPPQP